MGDAFGMVFGIIWIIVLISVFSKIAAKARQNQNRPNQQPPQSEARQAAVQERNVQTQVSSVGSSKPTFRNVPGSTYGTSRNIQQLGYGTTASRNSGYGQGAFAPSYTSGKVKSTGRKDTISGTVFGPAHAGGLGNNPVLLEDRRNDWLAKQLREEAAIKRRGSIYDLGASHDVSCDADNLKRYHTKRHNTNGLNRQTFK